MNLKKTLLLCSITFTLSACSIFSPYGTSNIPEPAPLTHYTPQITPKILWRTNVGAASDGIFLPLAPCVAGNTIYTIDVHGRLNATSLQGERLWHLDNAHGGERSGAELHAQRLVRTVAGQINT